MQEFQDSQKRHHKTEITVLVITVIIIAALVTWLIIGGPGSLGGSTYQGQKKPDSQQIKQRNNRFALATFGVSFLPSQEHGDITVTNFTGGKFPSVTLVSEKLNNARYYCDGENTGAFGVLGVQDPNDNGPQPQFKKKINGKIYGFTSSLTQLCYKASLLKEFRTTVPKAIIENLKPLSGELKARAQEQQETSESSGSSTPPNNKQQAAGKEQGAKEQ